MREREENKTVTVIQLKPQTRCDFSSHVLISEQKKEPSQKQKTAVALGNWQITIVNTSWTQ